jgi:arylsulfatase A-like enzyme
MKIKSSIAILSIILSLLICSMVGFKFTGYIIKNDIEESIICKGCNVILISIDTLRADHLSVYGYERETSPNIDLFAKQNILFKNHHSQIPFTPPSHWSIMTGLYPHNHNITMVKNISFDYEGLELKNEEPFPDEIDTNQVRKILVLSKYLEKKGYKTAGFVSSRMVQSLKVVFQEFEISYDKKGFFPFDFNKNKEKPKFNKENFFKKFKNNKRNNFTNFFENNNNLDEELPEKNNPSFETTEKSLTWLEKNKNENFFLFIHFWDVHHPYSPPDEYDIFSGENEDIVKYDGEIKFVDYKVKLILDKLEKLNLLNDTIILITADHGESFEEYDCSDFSKKKQKCLGHYSSLYEPEIHVPLIMSIPSYKNSKVIEEVTQSVDIVPSLLYILGFNISKELDGSSIVPLLFNKPRENNIAFSELNKGVYNSKSLISENYKLIKIDQNGKSVIKLFDLEKGEGEDVSIKKNKIKQSLEKEIDKLIQNKQNFEEEPSKEDMKLLRSLGYLE